MKKRFAHILPFLLLLQCISVQAQIPIGHWRDHLSYNSVQHVCVLPSSVFAAANQGIFQYDCSDYTITKHNKTTDLNDGGISAVAYDTISKYTVVAYTNSNIDILYKDEVYNISDIKRSGITGDKSIHSILFYNNRAYLACGFGIAVVNLARHEIEDTYYIGNNGAYINVNDIAFTDSLIVAATAEGLRYAPKNSPFLNIVTNWKTDTTSILSSQPITRLVVNGNNLLAASYFYNADSLAVFPLTLTAEGWLENGPTPCFSGNIKSLRKSHGKLIVSFWNRVDVYNEDYQLAHRISNVDWVEMQANDADLGADGTLWIAHNWAGLLSVNLNTAAYHILVPTGPVSDNIYRLTTFEDRVMVCPGGKSTTYTNAYISPNVYIFQDETWQQLNCSAITQSFFDILDVAVNPKNKKEMLATSWGYGVLDITSNVATTLYNNTNTAGALTPYTSGSYSALRMGAVAFDSKGNAWFTNSLGNKGLAVRYKDGSWNSFNISGMVQSEIDKILCDSVRGYKWFAGRANLIYVHSGDSLMAYVDPNNGSKMETSSVNCFVQDHSGDIWVGTNKGLKIITNGSQAFANGGAGEKSPVTCLNITISNGDIAEYLMAYETVTAIAVDGANRKWVGTAAGGLYLISADGMDELQHFTASNSPLFSDKIITLAIQPQTGEVFVGTDKGLQSYRGTATYAEASPQSDIHAFPNPVTPDYSGPIAIKGFSRNALVHITDAAGHVVFTTTANGGQAIWSGCTNSGTPVASGAYFVFASDEEGQMRVVTKVLVIR